jgi:shikimate kinase
MTKNNIVLTGFMGTGKSTVGRLLSTQLGYQFIDTDQLIEEQIGCSIADYFTSQGEAAFRQRELELAQKLAQRSELVISTGGGMLLNPAIAATLGKTGQIFCLTAPAEEILERVKSEIATRPLLQEADPLDRIKRLLKLRCEGYARFAQVNTSGKKPLQIVEEIAATVHTTEA